MYVFLFHWAPFRNSKSEWMEKKKHLQDKISPFLIWKKKWITQNRNEWEKKHLQDKISPFLI